MSHEGKNKDINCFCWGLGVIEDSQERIGFCSNIEDAVWYRIKRRVLFFFLFFLLRGIREDSAYLGKSVFAPLERCSINQVWKILHTVFLVFRITRLRDS